MNATENFQRTIAEAVNEAAQKGVHPAIVYTVLGGIQSDVLFAIKQSNRQAQTADLAAVILKSQNDKPTNVIQLPKADSSPNEST